MRKRPYAARLAAAVGAGCLLAGCAGPAGGEGSEQTLTVLAAASLADVFTGLADDFESEHPGTSVEFSFGSSTDLAGQAADGAPGDVLATADRESMALAVDAGVTASAPVRFATNTVVLVVPADDPGDVAGPEDLADATWVRCADAVPCGRATLPLLEAHGVTSDPVSLEEDVRATLDKVVSGAVDAGFVYASDAVAAGDAVQVRPLAAADGDPTSYLLAPLDQGDSPSLADDWVSLVTGPEGRAALDAAGFGTP